MTLKLRMSGTPASSMVASWRGERQKALQLTGLMVKFPARNKSRGPRLLFLDRRDHNFGDIDNKIPVLVQLLHKDVFIRHINDVSIRLPDWSLIDGI